MRNKADAANNNAIPDNGKPGQKRKSGQAIELANSAKKNKVQKAQAKPKGKGGLGQSQHASSSDQVESGVDKTAYEKLVDKVNERRKQQGIVGGKSTGDFPVEVGVDQCEDLNQSYDGVEVNVNASDDDFDDSEVNSDDELLFSQADAELGSNGPPSEQLPSVSKTNEDEHQIADAESSRQAKLRAWKNDLDFKLFVAEVIVETTAQSADKESRTAHTSAAGKNHNNAKCITSPKVNLVKSPSDTTIYKSAFKVVTDKANNVIEKISNFVEGMQITSERGSSSAAKVPARGGTPRSSKQGKDKHQTEIVMGTSAAEQVIIDAEQFRAQLQPPKGTTSIDNDIMKLLNKVDDDDEFFNVTCHIDPVVKGKIEKGEFVELECLLPKDPAGGGGVINVCGEDKVELVSRDEHTYFKPVKESQINGLHKWEEAFRVYAAIYTQAHPEQSGEVWQYMHVINVAASAYQWSNIAYYDVTFRQLMAFKPNRSWAKIYNQGWNLVMKEPLGSRGSYAQNQNNAQQSNGNQHYNKGGMKRDWRDDCCWRFNKNRCKRADCHFDHRCTYCGAWHSHRFYNVRRCLSKECRNQSGNRKRNSSPRKSN